jgi:hypothetical protein
MCQYDVVDGFEQAWARHGVNAEGGATIFLVG